MQSNQNRSSSNIKKLFLLSSAALLLAGPFAIGATAQGAPGNNQDDTQKSDVAKEEKPAAKDEIIVTATGMRTVVTSQIMKIDGVEFERQGLNNVDDLMRIIPQNFSNINSATNNGVFTDSFANPTQDPKYGVRVNGAAGTGANFRGLGNNATLTLVNGRRLTQDSSSAGAFSDVSIIPLAAIDHVEVLTDGASTAYGSGAIAGVINFILKKNYNGAETAIRYENSKTGGDRYSVSQVAGYSNDIARIIGGFTYAKSDPVLASKAVDTLDLRAKGGRDHRNYEFDSPGIFIRSRGSSTFGAFDILGQVPAGNGAPALADLDPAAVTGRTLLPLHLTPKQDRKNAFLSMELDVNDSLTFFAEGIYSIREITSTGGYIRTSGTFFEDETEVRRRRSSDPRIRHGRDSVVFGPARDLSRIPVKFGYLFDRETEAGLLPRLGSSVSQDNFNMNLGFAFELPLGDWKGNTALYLSRDDSKTSIIAAPRGQSRLSRDDRVSNPQSDRSRRFPDYVLMLMKGYTLESNGNIAVTPLNLFGDGTQNSKETLSHLFRSGTGSSSSGITGFQAVFDGTILQLPGGDVKMAFGADLYQENLAADYINFDGEDKARDSAARQNLPDSERDAMAFFGEISIPLVGDSNAMTGVQGLQIGLALRYDNFNDRGFKYAGVRAFDPVTLALDPAASTLVAAGGKYDAFSPKVGIAWQPGFNTEVFLNWSKSFRAPTLYDRFFLPDLPDFDLFYDDPHLIPGPGFFDSPIFGGTVNDFDAVFNDDPDAYSLVALYGGNPDTLKPVTADNYSIGFDHNFDMISGLRVGAKYAYIDIRNEIADASNARIFRVISDPNNAAIFADRITRRGPTSQSSFFGLFETDGRITFMDQRTINIAKKVSETLDLSADYTFSVNNYDLNVGAIATYTFQLSETLAKGLAPVDLAGTNEGPQKWQGFGYVGVGRGNWYFRTNIRHQSAYRDLDFNLTNPAFKSILENVGAYTTADANVTYRFDDANQWLQGARISVGVNNLFSPDFPVLDRSPGFDLNRVDVRKRVFYIDIKKAFQ